LFRFSSLYLLPTPHTSTEHRYGNGTLVVGEVEEVGEVGRDKTIPHPTGASVSVSVSECECGHSAQQWRGITRLGMYIYMWRTAAKQRRKRGYRKAKPSVKAEERKNTVFHALLSTQLLLRRHNGGGRSLHLDR